MAVWRLARSRSAARTSSTSDATVPLGHTCSKVKWRTWFREAFTLKFIDEKQATCHHFEEMSSLCCGSKYRTVLTMAYIQEHTQIHAPTPMHMPLPQLAAVVNWGEIGCGWVRGGWSQGRLLEGGMME